MLQGPHETKKEPMLIKVQVVCIEGVIKAVMESANVLANKMETSFNELDIITVTIISYFVELGRFFCKKQSQNCL